MQTIVGSTQPLSFPKMILIRTQIQNTKKTHPYAKHSINRYRQDHQPTSSLPARDLPDHMALRRFLFGKAKRPTFYHHQSGTGTRCHCAAGRRKTVCEGQFPGKRLPLGSAWHSACAYVIFCNKYILNFSCRMILSLPGSPLLQRQSYQSVRLVSHKQRNVQHIAIQLQIIQREPHPEPDLI